jgi:hypothetical protein
MFVSINAVQTDIQYKVYFVGGKLAVIAKKTKLDINLLQLPRRSEMIAFALEIIECSTKFTFSTFKSV